MNEKHTVGLAAAVLSASVFAQDQGTEPPAPRPDQVNTVVVTGTSVARSNLGTAMSATVFNSKDIARLTSSSQADLLATVPGMKAEGGGGEIGANVQVRGLPSPGQYQFTPLEYDGMPVLATHGLNSSTYDIFMRNDLGIQRLEFVTGGVSNLFGPGSVAGIINYISRKGGEVPQGTLQVEVAEKGRVRTDVAASGPLGGGNYYAFSGYYRYDEGPLKSGLATHGFQLRGNVMHKVDGGALTVYAQAIDDSVQYFPPLPLVGSSLERATDRYGSTIYTTDTAQAAGLTSILPNGQRFVSPIGKGAYTQGGALAVVLDRDLGNDLGIDIKAKGAHYQHQFNFFVDGDGIVNAPETLGQYLANRKIAGPGSFTYADNGAALPADALLYANRILNRNRPTTDFSAEANLTKKIERDGATHNLTLGAWAGYTQADDVDLTQTFLAEYANQPRLVDLSAGGVAYTSHGLVDPSVSYSNNSARASRAAVYLADQIEMGRWSFDAGTRIEHLKGSIRRELTKTYNGVGQGGTTEAPALTSAVYGNGTFQQGTVQNTEWAASGAALYKVTDKLNVYGNLSRGYFFPEMRSISFDPLGRPQSYEGEVIRQAELGTKYASGPFYGTVALFHSTLKNRRTVDFVNDGQGGLTERVLQYSTRASGIEATGDYRLTRALGLTGNVTYTDDEITQGQYTGNAIERKPKWFANASLNYDDGRYDGSLSWNYQSDAFSSPANNIVLPAYSLWRLTAGYRVALAGKQSLRFGLAVFNLFDSQGLAEGSPRQGTNQTAGGLYFDGRPILPRRISLTATYNY